MEDGSRKLVEQVVATAAVLLCAATAYAQPGTATGAITVNGKEFALHYAYASVQPGFFDKDGDDMSGFLFLDAFDGMVSAAGMHRFAPATLERLLISGRVFTEGPRTFSGVTWAYDATFSCAVVRPPTAAEAAAALQSPAAAAVTAHLAAIQTGFDAYLATLTEPSAASYRTPDGLKRFEAVRAETPADSRLVALAEGPEDTRVATVQAARRDGVIVEFSLKLRRTGTVWKVDR